MKSEFESREAFECIFGDEGEIDLSKDETGEYSFQPSRFAYSFFLVAWQYRQTEVDALTLQVAEMKSRLNDAYTDGQSAMYTARQSKIDELQKQVDAVKTLIEEYKDPPTEDKAFRHALSIVAYELEQALKGENSD